MESLQQFLVSFTDDPMSIVMWMEENPKEMLKLLSQEMPKEKINYQYFLDLNQEINQEEREELFRHLALQVLDMIQTVRYI